MPEFDVNIRTTGDTSGADKVKEALREVKAEEATDRGLTGAKRVENAQDIRALERDQAAIIRQINSDTTSLIAKEAERLAIEQRRASLIAQKQIITDLELEQQRALVAGDSQRAAVLEIELNIRRQAVQLMTSAALSEEEATAIATQRVGLEAQITFQKQLQVLAAQEANAGNLLAGASLGKARIEATTLARELASGASTGRTIGALVGTLGPQLGIAGLAAYVIYENFHKVEGAIQSITDGLSGLSGKALAEEITAADKLRFAIQDAEKQTAAQLAGNIEKAARELTLLTDAYREAVLSGDSKASADLLKKISARQTEIEILRQQRPITEALETIEAQQTEEVKRRTEARKAEISAQSEGIKLAKEFQKERAAGFTDAQKVEADKLRIANIRDELQKLGVTADTAVGAYNKSIGPGDAETQNRIRQLAIEWQKLGAEVKKVTDAMEDQRKKAAGLQTKEGDELKQLQEIQREAAKPNLSVAERLKLLEAELKLLQQIKQTVTERAAVAAKVNPAATERINEINQTLKTTAPTGRPEDADARGELIKERATLAKASGIPADLAKTTGELDKQITEIQKATEATKKGTGDAARKLTDLDKAANEGFNKMSRTLDPFPAQIGAKADQVNIGLQNLGGATQEGFKAMGAQIAAVQSSLQRTIAAEVASLQSQINGLGK